MKLAKAVMVCVSAAFSQSAYLTEENTLVSVPPLPCLALSVARAHVCSSSFNVVNFHSFPRKLSPEVT